jgi:hypothetical protein
MSQNVERYGIFRKLPDGSPMWVGAENDFEKAVQTMRDLARTDGMEYFVHDFRKGVSIPMIPTTGDTPSAE